MPIQLHHGHRLEALFDRLETVMSDPLPSPLEPEIVVVQSRGMARWLTQNLSRRHKICMNVRFPFPNHFLDSLTDQLIASVGAPPLYDKDRAAWRLFRRLPEFAAGRSLGLLSDYLRPDGDPGLRKRLELAATLASLFDHYSVFRPEWTGLWDRGKSAQEGDQWQADLYRELKAESPFIHRKDRFSLAAASLGQIGPGILPARVALFGISSLPPLYLDFFSLLSDHFPVHFFVLNPCREYWFERWPKGPAAGSRPPEVPEDRLPRETGNPLLTGLGGQGADFLTLLLDYNALEDALPESGSDRPHLLGLVQADILRAAEPDKANPGPPPAWTLPPNDRSLTLHACHGPMREVEVLFDHVLDFLQAHPDAGPRDILVMAPDIDGYAPYVNAVFGNAESELGMSLPYSLADIRIADEAESVCLFFDLLGLKRARLTAVEVIGLLERAPVLEKWGLELADLDWIRSWVLDAGIAWGLDGDHKARLGLPADPENSWAFGLDRLLLGSVMLPGPDNLYDGILPVEGPEGASAVRFAAFLDFLDALFTLHNSLQEPAGLRTPAEWTRFLRETISRFIPATRDHEAALLDEAIAIFSASALDTAFNDKIPIEAVLQWLSDRLSGELSRRGYLDRGITFSTLMPMRGIPFRMIAVIGLDHGSFPRHTSLSSFDLSRGRGKRRLGDRLRESEDRHLFLETLISARDRLHLSYAGRDLSDNSEVPPSTVVSELVDYLKGRLAPESDYSGLPRSHGLHAFDTRYFQGDAPFFSFSKSLYRARAGALTGPSLSLRPFQPSPLPEPLAAFRTLTLHDLAAFFANPCRFVLRKRLGLYLPAPEEALPDAEPFTADSRIRSAFRNEFVDAMIKGTFDPAAAFQRARAGGALPHGKAGEFDFELLKAESAEMAGRIRGICGEVLPVSEKIDLSIDPFRLEGRIDGLLPDGRLLHFRGSSLRSGARLRLWIQCLASAAAHPERIGCQGHYIGKNKNEIDSLTVPANPESLLGSLLAVYWEGLMRLPRFFPDTSLAYAAEFRKSGRDNALKKAFNSWTCSFGGMIPEGADSYFTLCFGTANPLTPEFERLAVQVFDPYLAAHPAAAEKPLQRRTS